MPSVSSMEIGHNGAGLPVRMIHRHPIIAVEDFGESGIERHEAWKIRCAAERRMGLPPWPRAVDWVPGFEVLITNPWRRAPLNIDSLLEQMRATNALLRARAIRRDAFADKP